MTKKLSQFCIISFLLLKPIFAQAPLPDTPSPANHVPSEVDLFAGYSYWMPHVVLEGTHFSNDNKGMIVSGAYYLNRTFGLEFAADWHLENADDSMRSLSIGPAFRRTLSFGLTPFVHTLIGAADISGPTVPEPVNGGLDYVYLPARWGPQITLGGGVDYPLPYFHHHLGARVQADYLYDHINYEPVAARANFNSGRFSSGVVWRLGSISPPPSIAYSCSATPDSIYPGDPLSLNGEATNVEPKKPIAYSWEGQGFPFHGNAATATVPTQDLKPGNYAVVGHANQGQRANESAECSVQFTVKAFEPPKLTCTASPQSMTADGMAVILAHGTSPQNRPLQYSYSASAGSVEGKDSAAKLSARGAPAGAITVTCQVTDDKGVQASAETTVTVEAPPPPAPKTETLCSIDFSRDTKQPARVNNEAKACLDEVALNAQSHPDATLVLVGNQGDPYSGRPQSLAAQRALNTKEYLAKDKGLDPNRIQLRAGASKSETVNNYLVPAGADFDHDVPGTSLLNVSMIPEVKR